VPAALVSPCRRRDGPPRALPSAGRRPSRRWLATRLRRTAPRGLWPFIATRADVRELAALSLAEFGDNAMTPAGLAYYIERGHALVFGLRKGTRVAAYCVCELNDGMRRAYVVETLTCAPLRGRGLGSWLRARVEDVAVHLEYRSIASHVAVTNAAARRLNERAGLVVVRRIARYYDDGRDGLYLRKTLVQPAGGAAGAEAIVAGAGAAGQGCRL
jgi:ribosomal protein S18 acetylase RimI-like enzyme